MIRRIVAAVGVMLAYLAPVRAAQQNSTVEVMTQNMDAGTDLGYALFGLQQPDPRPYIDLTLADAQGRQYKHLLCVMRSVVA